MYIIIDNKKIEIKEANTFFKKLKGLMGKKNIDYGMLFNKINSIHTFFMKDSIDVLALNENNEVILKCEDLKKNKILNVNNKIKNTSILELPKNTIKNIQVGDIIEFKK